MRRIFFFFVFTIHIFADDGCRLVNELHAEFIRYVAKKYKIKCEGTVASFPKKLESIGVSFAVDQLLSIDESRLLIVNLVKDFQIMINQNEEIKPILANVPFPADRVEITIFLYKDKKLPAPDVFSHIFTARGNIIYSTCDMDKSIFNQTKIREPLEEACTKTGVAISLIRSTYSDYNKGRKLN